MFKINENHHIVLIEFMEKHPQFARGQFSGPSGKSVQRKLWEELTEKLNSLGYGEKPVEKWQKTWADMKYALKKRSGALNKDFNKTGGGVGIISKLNTYEERILNLLGKTFSDGVGSSECGIEDRDVASSIQMAATSSKSTYILPGTDSVEIHNISDMQQNFKILGMSDIQNATSSNLTPAVPPQPGVNSPVDMYTSVLGDHTYVHTPHRKRKKTHEETENELYRETIDELKSIKMGVYNISENLGNINDTLKEIKTAILEQNKL